MTHAKISQANIRLKRAYEPATADDGSRILVDRLWPRGIKKEAAAIEQWIKDIAPTTELRKWFGHDPEKWAEFQRRYGLELQSHGEILETLRDRARQGPVTLIYSAHDEAHNDAVVLRKVLIEGQD